MGVGNFFHRLFNPHCPECAHEMECPSCDILREQLALANREKERLLEIIINKNKPEVAAPTTIPEPIKPSFIPWRVKQQMLESEDRERARKLKEVQEAIKNTTVVNVSDLEREMDIAPEREAEA